MSFITILKIIPMILVILYYCSCLMFTSCSLHEIKISQGSYSISIRLPSDMYICMGVLYLPEMDP